MVNCVPRSTSLCRRISPPWASTIFDARESYPLLSSRFLATVMVHTLDVSQQTDLDMIGVLWDDMHHVVCCEQADHDSAGTRNRDDSGGSHIRRGIA
jgi:hypothetical protein